MTLYNVIEGTETNDTLLGTIAADFVFSSTGHDHATGGVGADILRGHAGDDTLDGEEGVDTLTGGAGEDVFLFANATHSTSLDGDVITDFEQGTDKIDLSGVAGITSFADLTLTNGSGESVFTSGAFSATVTGDITLTADDFLFTAETDTGATLGADTLTGTSEADSILGLTGDDIITGEDGNDYLQGNQGADTVSGGAGSDTVVGGQGADIVDGGADADFVLGNQGNDSLTGGDGDDTFHGGKAHDTISGGAGADVIYGDRGDNLLSGGAGADTFVYGIVQAHDLITDFEVGIDHLQFIGVFATASDALAEATQVGVDTRITFEGGADITLAGVDASLLTTESFLIG